ncbi:hypothetical protein [Mesorhizobium onobrychidis]|uniref:hypothetical protein n=1 Tax=Mesorhizobium onobrychidis TaxID=2775404 RepID=UPI002158780E|nr:hypothetical protein [Mesorhizobium onobrychidis]
MIIITAATGRYGRLVVDALLRRGVSANEIVAAVRNPGRRLPSTPLADVVAATPKRNGLL